MLTDNQLYIAYTLMFSMLGIMILLVVHALWSKRKISYKKSISKVEREEQEEDDFIELHNEREVLNGKELKSRQMNMAKINALMRKVDTSMARTDYVEAEKHLLSILSIDEDHVDANLKLALLFMKIDKYDKAIHMYHQCLELLPNDPALYTNLGLAYFKKKDYNMAIHCYSRALELDDAKGSRYVNLAYVYNIIGEKDEAIKNYEMAVKKTPKNVDYIFMLADAYAENGMRDEAKYYYKKVLELEPFNEEAKLKSKVG